MNAALQNLEIKVENGGTTPQGRLTSSEWNILVAAVKALDADSDNADVFDVLQIVEDAGYATQDWVNGKLTDYATQSSLNALSLGILGKADQAYVDNTFVKLATAQSIAARHNFVDGLKIGDLPIYKIQGNTIYLDANLVVSGAMTIFGKDSTTFPTIWANIPFDNTMSWDGSKWSVAGGGSGSGLDLVQLEEYLTTNGYATQSWVTGRGYITSSALEPYALKTAIPTSLKNPNSLSWSGFSSGSYDGSIAQSIALPTKLSQLTDDVVNGKYLPLTGGTISTNKNEPLTINSTALYSYASFSVSGVKKAYVGWDSYGAYIYNDVCDKYLHITDAGVAAFQNQPLLHSGNYSDYALPKDGTASAAWKLANVRYLWGQLFDGTSNIGGQMSFNAGDFILAHNATDAWTDGNGLTHPWYGIDFRAGGSYKGYISHWSGISLVSGNDINLSSQKNIVVSNGNFRINQSAFDNGLILNRTVANSGVGIVAMSNDVRLGQFGINGTKTFEIAGDNGIVAQVSTTTGNAMLIHGSGSYAEGLRLANRNGKTSTWSGIHLGCDPTQTTGTHSTQWLVGRNGNNNYFVVRNNATDYLQIDLSGNLLIKGAITMYYSSDKRLKQNIRTVNASKTLMSLGGVFQYEYIDSEVAKNSTYEGSHYGLIYQNVKGSALDKMCFERDDGFGALNYLDTNFISLIAGATMENISEVEKLKKENKALRKRVEQIEKRVA